MSAGGLLRQVLDAGGGIRAEDGELVVRAPSGAVGPALLSELRERKAQVLAVLKGELCRRCEAPIDWRVPGGIIFGDGTAEHLACYENADAPRRTAATGAISADGSPVATSAQGACAPSSARHVQPAGRWLARGDTPATAPEHQPAQPLSVPLGSPGAGQVLPPPPSKRYGVIYGDPPLAFATRSPKGKGRSAEAHYDCMNLEQIKALPVADWAADDAVLLLWVTNPTLPKGLEVISAWGFEYKTLGLCWAKQNRAGNGFFTGMGFWTQSNAELCLLATRGRPKHRWADVPQLVVAPRREHSRKPDEVHERIERLVDGPYLELFARATRPGWESWGAQAGLFDGDPIATRRWASDSYPDAAE